MLLLWVGWTLAGVGAVGGNRRVRTGVGLRGEGSDQSVERGPLQGLLLLSLCVILGLPLPLAEGLVQGLSFLLWRYTLLKTMFLGFLGWKWWATKVAPKEGLGLLLRFNSVRVEIRELRPRVVAKGDGVLVHCQSRTNVQQGLSSKTLA